MLPSPKKPRGKSVSPELDIQKMPQTTVAAETAALSNQSVLATPAQRQKLRIARNGKVLGEWTKTELYPLLRASEVFPSDYYWHEGMNEWRRLAEFPSGKSVVAAPAQRQNEGY